MGFWLELPTGELLGPFPTEAAALAWVGWPGGGLTTTPTVVEQ
ncbi:MAG: hypothetical protein ACOYOQ_00505 [Microthrixaceae bacterium]